MIDRSYLFAGLFSLGIHGVLASFLIPSLPKASLEKSFTMEVVWREPSTHCHSHDPGYARGSQLCQKHSPWGAAEGRSGNLGKPKKEQKEKKIVSLNQAVPLMRKNFQKTSNALNSNVLGHEDGIDNKGSGNDSAPRSAGIETHKNLQRKAYHPLPKYPWVCRKRHQEGVVSLNVKTNGEGRVIDVRLDKSSGYARLDETALQALKSWIFAEGSIQKTLSIAFRLKG